MRSTVQLFFQQFTGMFFMCQTAETFSSDDDDPSQLIRTVFTFCCFRQKLYRFFGTFHSIFIGVPKTHLPGDERSEEHTSELQSRFELVCRLLLEKKKQVVI